MGLCSVGGFLWTLHHRPHFLQCPFPPWAELQAQEPSGRGAAHFPWPLRQAGRGWGGCPSCRRVDRSCRNSVVVICVVKLLRAKFKIQVPAQCGAGHALRSREAQPAGAPCGRSGVSGFTGRLAAGVVAAPLRGLWVAGGAVHLRESGCHGCAGGGPSFLSWLPDPCVSGTRPAGQETRKPEDRDTSDQRRVTRQTVGTSATTLAANALGFRTMSACNHHFPPLTHTSCPGLSARLLPSHIFSAYIALFSLLYVTC